MSTKAAAQSATTAGLQNAGKEKYKLMRKSLEEIENIYKEIAEEDKRLCEAFLSIGIETIEAD